MQGANANVIIILSLILTQSTIIITVSFLAGDERKKERKKTKCLKKHCAAKGTAREREREK